MKKTVLLAVLALTGVTAFGQGTVLFNNRYPANSIDAPVFQGSLSGAKLDGSLFMGQLYAGVDKGALTAIGVPVAFRTGAGAGYITGGDIAVPGIAPGAAAWVQLRAWETAKGSSFEASSAAGGFAGSSVAVQINLGGTGTPPGPGQSITGLQSFAVTVIPEPSTIALGLLGVAGLLIRRRK